MYSPRLWPATKSGCSPMERAQLRDGEGEREQRRLRYLGLGEPLHGPLEAELPDRKAGSLAGLGHVAVEELRLGLEQIGAHADLL